MPMLAQSFACTYAFSHRFKIGKSDLQEKMSVVLVAQFWGFKCRVQCLTCKRLEIRYRASHGSSATDIMWQMCRLCGVLSFVPVFFLQGVSEVAMGFT
eukprot:6143273-Amphidinium_carterae.1